MSISKDYVTLPRRRSSNRKRHVYNIAGAIGFSVLFYSSIWLLTEIGPALNPASIQTAKINTATKALSIQLCKEGEYITGVKRDRNYPWQK